MSDSTDSSFRFKHKFIIQYSYRLEKKIHCTKWGLKILRIFIIITNGIRKVRKGVEIFEKRILVLVSSSQTQCFRTGLVYIKLFLAAGRV